MLNETDGRDAVERVRACTKGVVVDPSRIGVDGWSQADYMAFWLGFMRRFPITVVAAPGWQYSRGARTEVNLARSQQVAVLDVAGSVLSDELITCQLQAAVDRLQQFGFAPEIIGAYLEPIVLHGGLTQSAAAKAFDWLAGERSYQLAKFGTAVDDEHTLAGVGVDTWWDQQLTNYLGRFRLFGPDQILGRQAMAKFVATSLGMLESSIRVYGDLPQSGVASGEIRKSAHEEDPR